MNRIQDVPLAYRPKLDALMAEREAVNEAAQQCVAEITYLRDAMNGGAVVKDKMEEALARGANVHAAEKRINRELARLGETIRREARETAQCRREAGRWCFPRMEDLV